MEFFTDIGINLTNLWMNFAHSFHLNFIAEKRYLLIVNGLKFTILLSICSILLGLILGCLTNVFRRSRFRILKAIGYIYVDVIRGTPTVTQLLIINFVIFASITVDKFWVGVLAFGLNSGAYIAEIIRAGIESVDKGQMEAGGSLGLSNRETMMFIIFPQAIKNILPALANEFIVLIKETAIVGYIAMIDLTKAGDIIRSRTFAPFMPLIGVAIIYYVLVKILTLFIAKLERWLKKADHR